MATNGHEVVLEELKRTQQLETFIAELMEKGFLKQTHGNLLQEYEYHKTLKHKRR